MESAPILDETKVGDFVNHVRSLGATLNGALVVIGDKLGLYAAMAGAGGLTPGQLVARTGATERYVREWLSAQAAGGYVDYDAPTGTYTLPAGNALVLSLAGGSSS
jgi:hypothetical protein